MKVLLTKKMMSQDIAYIQSRVSSDIELLFPVSYDETTLIYNVAEADVLLGGYFSEGLLTHAKNLKFAQIPWTGVDNLDFDLLRRHKVVVCNSHSNSEVVAEHAVAMMMDAAKKLSYHDREMRNGNWNRLSANTQNKVSPFSQTITGSKVGIIGFGAIGQHIVNMLQGFNCSFDVFTRSGVIAKEFKSKAEGFQISDFLDKAKELDVVFVAIPLTKETQGMIDVHVFNAMSEHSILINISRGQVLNPAHLFQALLNKQIGGAAIDTWYNYPSPSNPSVYPSLEFPFHELDNIILSPHRAGYVDSGFPHLDDAIENLNRFAKGKSLMNLISLANTY
jgi:phosphoglycerate dehydrogenase-like enzyme